MNRWLIYIGLLYAAVLPAQTNLVPNPSFEDFEGCDLDFGDALKASPWMIENPMTTPDLFSTCDIGGFYTAPISNPCGDLYPYEGESMIGIVSIGFAEENMYAWLTDEIPQDVDIYIAYHIASRLSCVAPTGVRCFANTQALALADDKFSRKVILELDEVFNYTDTWERQETCYRADGTERIIMIGNYKDPTQIELDCESLNPSNFAYFYIDQVIVAPFDLLPNRVFVCGDDTLSLDLDFYGVELEWSDGYIGGQRDILQSGTYRVEGVLDDCRMTEEFEVVRLSDTADPIQVTICEGQVQELTAPIPALWSTGVESSSIEVSSPGIYEADVSAICEGVILRYEVIEGPCQLDYYVANAFSPNADGVNDELDFHFDSDFSYTGILRVYDRWGGLIHWQAATEPVWDGRDIDGEYLPSGVYVWQYDYRFDQEEQRQVLSGTVTIIR